MYYNKRKRNLPVYGVVANNLVLYTTTQKDVWRGQNRLPPRNFRRKSQDLFEVIDKKNTPVTTG